MFPTFAARPALCGYEDERSHWRQLAAVALVPATAEAKGKDKVLRGDFTLVGGDGDYVTGKFGKAHLVDGKRKDKLSVHVRRLAKRTTYTFKLQTGSCGGAEVTGWTYRKLKTSRKGVGNAWARSKTFKVVKGTKYFVAVYAPDNQLVVCARLSSKGKSHPHKSHGKRDHAPGHDDDKPRGKSDDAPGHAEDKPRGKQRRCPRSRRGQGPRARATTPRATRRTSPAARAKTRRAARSRGARNHGLGAVGARLPGLSRWRRASAAARRARRA